MKRRENPQNQTSKEVETLRAIFSKISGKVSEEVIEEIQECFIMISQKPLSRGDLDYLPGKSSYLQPLDNDDFEICSLCRNNQAEQLICSVCIERINKLQSANSSFRKKLTN
jgi:hypothetical protein